MITLSPHLQQHAASAAITSGDAIGAKLVRFGQAFKRAYNGLSRGDRASMKYGQASLHKAFWDCAIKAGKASSLTDFSTPDLEHLESALESMMPLMALAHLSESCPINGLNLGALLRGRDVAQRRIDALFSETSLPLMLDHLESILKITRAPLDAGVLLRDLCAFMRDPVTSRRLWARSFFTGMAPC